jgi:hypothetical protein
MMNRSRTEERTEERSEGRLSTAELASAAERKSATVDATPVQTRPEDSMARQALFDRDEGERFRTRWSDIQASFVDEPRHSVSRRTSSLRK